MKLFSGNKRSEESELLDVHMDDEDYQEDEIQHRNLKKSIYEISGKHGQLELRKELTNNILNIQSKDKVSLEDLISKDNKDELIELKKKLLKEVVLEKPMPKAEHEKIRRQIGYDEAVKVTSEWEPVVTENRKAVQMKFPLMQSDIASITKPKDLGKDQKPSTKLEQEVANALKGSAKGPMTREEERVLLSHLSSNSLHGISLKGAQEMRAEYMKQKALVSYYAAKMKRQNKIKSKKYHRIQKKARQKQEGQKLEVLKDKDPEAYREWLLKEEKKRIEERMTLKHKGASKHMKKQMSYAKYNPESRQAVNDMMEKGKELTQKQKKVHFSDEEDDDEDKIDDDDDGECIEEGLDFEENLGSSEDKVSNKRPLEGDDDDDDNDGFKRKSSKKHKKQKIDESDVLLSTAFEAVEEQDMVVEDKDILADFKEEKAAVEERDKVKDVNTFMEGWGSWSGKGIKVSKKKTKRFIIKAPEGPPRKDHKLNNVIISELKDESVSKHQVDALPRKFNNVHHFQESIRKPVGKQWNKEDKYRQKIKPKVVVKMGTVIEPLNKTEALKNYKGGDKGRATKNDRKGTKE